MKCPNCGKQIPRSSKFCGYCRFEFKKGKSSIPPIVFGIPIIVVAIFIGMLIGVKFSSNDQRPRDSYPAAPTERTMPTIESTEFSEPQRDIPEGTTLIEGSWETGNVTVVALDDSTLWIQITDDRPGQHYKNLGTPWDICFDFGTKLEYKSSAGNDCIAYPFHFVLDSLAFREMGIVAYEDGKTASYISREDCEKNLYLCQTELRNGDPHFNDVSIEFLDIEQNGNTYTTIITLPDWFDVSIYKDLQRASISLNDTDFYDEMHEYGSVNMYGKGHIFYPIDDPVLKSTEAKTTNDTNGVMAAGWKQLDNKYYYFMEDGTMATGELELDESRKVVFNDDGSFKYGLITEKPELDSFSEHKMVLTSSHTKSKSYYVRLKEPVEDCVYLYGTIAVVDANYSAADGKWQIQLRDENGVWRRAGFFEVSAGKGEFEIYLDEPVTFNAYVCASYSKSWSKDFKELLTKVTYRTTDIEKFIDE